MIEFFHHLFFPYCATCKNCDTLRDLLEKERHDKSKILEQLLEMNKPVIERESPKVELEETKSNKIPWKIQQAQLEAEDRQTAQLLRRKEKEREELEKISKLEKELEIGADNASIS